MIADFMQSILVEHGLLGKEFELNEIEGSVVTSKLSIINSLISLPNHYVNLIS